MAGFADLLPFLTGAGPGVGAQGGATPGYGAPAGGGFMGALQDSSSPLSMGLLGAAGGLLGASGPSATPVGFGDILGAGLGGGLGGYGLGQQMSKDKEREDLFRKILMGQAGIGSMGAMSGMGGGAPQSPGVMPGMYGLLGGGV